MVPTHTPKTKSHTFFHSNQQPQFKTPQMTAEEGEEEGFGGWGATAFCCPQKALL